MFCPSDWIAFVLYKTVSFFLISPLWLCILQHWWTCFLQMISSGSPICSGLTVAGSSSAYAVKNPNCPLHSLTVRHLHSMLLSVYRSKSGLMSVSRSLTRQSVASNKRETLVDTVICSICPEGGKTGWGVEWGDKGWELGGWVVGICTAARWIHTPAGLSDVACLEMEA